MLYNLGSDLLQWGNMIKNIAKNFDIPGVLQAYDDFGGGHINETIALSYNEDGVFKRYILQKLNGVVFPNLAELMENIVNVTTFLQKKYIAMGEDPLRKCINIIKTIDGKNYYTDKRGDVWRMMIMIESTVSYDLAIDNQVFEKTGKAFGEFISMLDDYPVDGLYEIIPDFHNTKSRFEAFRAAIKSNDAKRKKTCKKEINFIYENVNLCNIIVDKLISGELPTRVTHNDTKINNILMDEKTGDAVCVVDLDTIMPGSLLYDFGDGIRSGCNTAYEDEKDINLVDFDMEKFEYFSKGFIAGVGDNMKQEEKDLLHMAGIIITFECGIRFLTDYLNGDKYFKTTYPEHNLVRCRTQLMLVSKMLDKIDEMKAIVGKY